MLVKDFVGMADGMFKIVDAKNIGYKTIKKAEIEADKNVVREFYGDWEVVGFEAVGKDKIAIYAKA